jgi:hypothetical protein
MKIFFTSAIAATLLIVAAGFNYSRPLQRSQRTPSESPHGQSSLTGAWHAMNGTTEYVFIFQDAYFSCSVFDKQNKKFIRTWGGTFSEAGGQMHANIEFDTESKNNVGTHRHFPVTISGNSLKLNLGNEIGEWKRTDNGTDGLAGAWRISGRMRDGAIQPIEKSARKTLKILSSTRFQWMAINTETKEFFGTGGGTYTFKNGKYTENIEFFSRDSSRVGASLSFDGSVTNNVWTHKGLSSRGEPIHEEWSREK